MTQPTENQEENIFYLSDESFDKNAFNISWLEQQNAITEIIDNGRGKAYFFSLLGKNLVHRHYLRGGLANKFSTDQYLWKGADNSRAFREWRLLHKLFEEGFPVPEPWGSRVIKDGLFYTQDLITHQIPNAQTLANLLCKRSLEDSVWDAIGILIQKFQRRGIYHADLNANNILLDQQGRLFLIDFDRADVKKPGKWQQDNLDRLKRSFEKQLRLKNQFHYSSLNWEKLMAGFLKLPGAKL